MDLHSDWCWECCAWNFQCLCGSWRLELVKKPEGVDTCYLEVSEEVAAGGLVLFYERGYNLLLFGRVLTLTSRSSALSDSLNSDDVRDIRHGRLPACGGYVDDVKDTRLLVEVV